MNDGNNEKPKRIIPITPITPIIPINHLPCSTGYIFVTRPTGLIGLIGPIATLSAAYRLKIQFLTVNF